MMTGLQTEAFSMDAARLHAKLPAHKRLVERTIGHVQNALQLHPGTWACTASGGKDTTAMIGLAILAGWRGPLFHFKYRESEPETESLVCQLSQRFDLPLHVITVTGGFDTYDRAGGFFATPETPDQLKAVRWLDRAFRDDAHSYQREQGWSGVMMGLRKEESQARRISLRRTGILYKTKARDWMTLCPLAEWTARDIWAFTAAHDLPQLARYSHGDRTHPTSRSEEMWAACDLWARGQAENIRRLDPHRWVKLLEQFPDVRKEL